MEPTTNGAGRFQRIEDKLDAIGKDIRALENRLLELEYVNKFEDVQKKDRVSVTTYRWMIFSIIASAALGVATFVGRIIWGG